VLAGCAVRVGPTLTPALSHQGRGSLYSGVTGALCGLASPSPQPSPVEGEGVNPHIGRAEGNQGLALQPAVYFVFAVLLAPSVQYFVVSATGFHHFAGLGVFVGFQRAFCASGFSGRGFR